MTNTFSVVCAKYWEKSENKRISLLGKFLLLQIMIPDTIIYQQKARMQLHRIVEISSMKVR